MWKYGVSTFLLVLWLKYRAVLLSLQALSFWYKVISHLLLIKTGWPWCYCTVPPHVLVAKVWYSFWLILLCLFAWGGAQTGFINLTFMCDCTWISATYQVNLWLQNITTKCVCWLGSERPGRVFVPGMSQPGFWITKPTSSLA